MPSSIYTQISAAAREILKNPQLVDASNYGGIEGIFTEIDLLLLASQRNPELGSNEDAWREALYQANQVMGGYFRRGVVVRFGPVTAPGADSLDYARAASRIIYGRPDGKPKTLKTPNGSFGRLTGAERDGKAGRKVAYNRDDLKPWPDTLDLHKPVSPEEQENVRLRAEVTALRTELEGLMHELERLRGRAARGNGRSTTSGQERDAA